MSNITMMDKTLHSILVHDC